MGTLITIAIIIIVVCILNDYVEYKKVEPTLQKFYNELIEEGKQLKKEAEEKMAKEKCKKGGNCNFILENTTSEHLPGWGDEIIGYYRCTKCQKEKEETLQYPS